MSENSKKPITLTEETISSLIKIADDKKIFIEGNIVKLIDDQGNEDLKGYIESAIQNDNEKRKARLEVTKQVQDQNKLLTKKQSEIEKRNDELVEKQSENENLMSELKEALRVAENAKDEALNDLSLVQKKTQFELIGRIVQTALAVIMAVGVITTVLYGFAIFSESKETTLIGNTWSNLFGILLTNSFSIIGTIMGVKYAQEEKKDS
jgi:hypothetical protein